MPTPDGFRVNRRNRKSLSNKNTIPIEHIVAYYGGEVRHGHNVSVKCFMHKDSHKSAVIDTVNNLYYCHTCSQGGNGYNLIMIQEQVDFKDAFKRAQTILTGSGSPLLDGKKSSHRTLPRRTWTD